MIDPTQVLRADLRAFAGYASARRTDARGDTWLNANESPRASVRRAEA